ncbi:MAG TPA: copper resistance protein CopC [Jatrophihabitans sp.]|jgi:copper transport protein|nr:copper resistance protein CopC [Jatrophihabitans sp.]
MRRQRRTRIVVRLSALLLAGGWLIGLAAAPASAHAYLTSSTPADGATLTAPPATIRLAFSESVEVTATRIVITEQDGREFHVRSLRIVTGESTEDPSVVTGRVPALRRGPYHLAWQTLSSDDLHRTSGVLTFGIRRTVAASAFHEPMPRAEEAMSRWTLFGCVALALGGLLAGRLYRRSGGAPDLVRRSRRIAACAAGAGVLVSFGLLADQSAVSGLPLTGLLTSDYGLHWAIRAGGLILLAIAALAAGAGELHRRVVALLVAAVGCVGLGAALLGHSAAGAGSGPTRLGADALHMIAGATWAGTLGILAASATLGRARHPERAVAAEAALRAFRIPATAAISVVVVTGVYLASGVVGSVDAALLTFYGRTLLVKIAIFAAIGVFGLLNTRRVRQAAATRGTRRSVLAESVLAVAVLAAAAVLTSGQPAREPEFVAAPESATQAFVSDSVADLAETVRVGPNLPGSNVVLIDVLQTRRPAPAPIDQVLVRAVSPTGSGRWVAGAPLPDGGRWSASLELSAPGRTGIEVSVQRTGLAPQLHVFDWIVAAGAPSTRPATVSTRRIGGALRGLSIAIGLLTACGWAVAGLMRRRRSAAPPSEPDGVAQSGRELVGTG